MNYEVMLKVGAFALAVGIVVGVILGAVQEVLGE